MLSQLAHAFNCRSDRQSIFALGWLSNRPLVWATAGAAAVQLAILRVPWLRSVFGIGPLGGEEWLLALGLGLLPLAGMELEKAWGRMKKSSVMSLES